MLTATASHVVARAFAFVFVGAAFVWSYWNTIVSTCAAWVSHADYSHGFLVLPIAAGLLWARRSEYPGVKLKVLSWGWLLLCAAVAIRIIAGYLMIESLDGWTIPLWVAGVVVLAGGWNLLAWSGPSIAMLCFMFPMPYSIEQSLSQPLQSTATSLSTIALQILGFGAISEGNTIIAAGHTFEVEQACSGLRIFVGVFALAFTYVFFARRKWWESFLLLLSAVPIAIVANSVRIAITVALYALVSSDAAQRFTHDLSGWIMIPFAAALFGFVLWYVTRLFPAEEILGAARLVADDPRLLYATATRDE